MCTISGIIHGVQGGLLGGICGILMGASEAMGAGLRYRPMRRGEGEFGFECLCFLGNVIFCDVHILFVLGGRREFGVEC